MKLIDIKPKVAEFYLKHPVTLQPITIEDGSEVFWKVVGHDSSEYIEGQKEFLKDLEARGDDGAKINQFELQEQAQKQLAKLVKGWDSKFDDSMGGPYSHERVIEMLTSPDYRWIYTQLDSFVGQRRNFFQN